MRSDPPPSLSVNADSQLTDAYAAFAAMRLRSCARFSSSCFCAVASCARSRSRRTRRARSSPRRSLAEDAEKQANLVSSLAGQADADHRAAARRVEGRRASSFYKPTDGDEKSPCMLDRRKGRGGQAGRSARRRRASRCKDEDGKPLRLIAASRPARTPMPICASAMKGVLDLARRSPIPIRAKRLQAIEHDRPRRRTPRSFPRSQARQKTRDRHAKCKRALREAIALTQLKDPKTQVKIAALQGTRRASARSRARTSSSSSPRTSAERKPSVADSRQRRARATIATHIALREHLRHASSAACRSAASCSSSRSASRSRSA